MDAVAELTAFYKSYIDTFNRRDLPAVPRFFAYPWVTVDGTGTVHTIANEATQLAMWKEIITGLEAKEWSHSEIEHLDVHLTGADTGLLATDFVRWRKGGTPIERRRGFYVVRRFDDGWKIVSAWDAARPFPAEGADDPLAEMRSFFKAYGKAVNREDWDHVTQCYTYPWVWESEQQGTQITPDRDAYMHSIQQNTARLKGMGAVCAGVDSFRAHATGNDTGLLVVDITRYRDDDSAVEKKRVNYMLRRMEGAWKITAIVDTQRPL